MQLVTPILGSIEVARTHLGAAQGAAATILNDPTASALPALAEGIRQAQLAADELFSASPRSKYQDLGLARQHVVAGRDSLEQARSILFDWGGTQDPRPLVERLARDAFDIFEEAFEILDND